MSHLLCEWFADIECQLRTAREWGLLSGPDWLDATILLYDAFGACHATDVQQVASRDNLRVLAKYLARRKAGVDVMRYARMHFRGTTTTTTKKQQL